MTIIERFARASSGAVLLAALALPGQVQAQDIENTMTVPGGPVVAPTTRPFANAYPAPAGTTFLDHWLFTLTPDSNFLSVTLAPDTPDGTVSIDPDSFDTELFTAGGTLVASGATFDLVAGTLSLISLTPILAGDYDLRVEGTLTGTVGGAYFGQLAVSPLVVIPEPETYALLLAGLGLIGFVARRRSRALTVAA